MKVLGISSHYHDASAALVVDGSVMAAAAEERFTLQKHDPTFPLLAARACLAKARIEAHELDRVVYHEDTAVKFTRNFSAGLARFPFSPGAFVKSMEDAVTSGFWIRNEISKKLDIDPGKVFLMPHHLSHAALSFLGSPYQKAAILIMDAVGEWTCSSIFVGDRSKENFLELEEVIPFPQSLGLVYSAFTAFLGFKVNDGECSTMALAAFGRPIYADSVRKVLRPGKPGIYQVDDSYLNLSSVKGGVPVSEKFFELFGPARSPHEPLPFDSMPGGSPEKVTDQSRRYADIAASLQLVLEECVLGLAAYVKEKTGLSQLCLGGGVALNCVANGKLLESGLFTDYFVPPDPGDGGGAMGAALYGHWMLSRDLSGSEPLHPFKGAEYSDELISDLVDHAKVNVWRKFSMLPLGYRGFRKEKCSSEAELTEKVAELLAGGAIVGWCQGRFENGPRALGARSILIDPERVDLARKLSRSVKRRAPFRPYACSILEDAASEVLELPKGCFRLHSWMQASAKVKASSVDKLRASLHTDLTTRPQICSREEQPLFAALLEAFGKRKGLPVLLNTSFNESGLPMVAGPVQALAMFVRTEMDVLVVGKTIISKEY